jgi:predicted Zn-dependent protease
LYRAVLAKHPNNTEALSGLGDLAAKRNDSKGAAAMYDKVLEHNPSYLPALVASADQKWAGGDRRGAVELYRRIVSQAGSDSSYTAKALKRIAEFEQPAHGGASTPKPEEPARPPAEEPPAPAPPSDEAPHIDTTDLPEFSR